MAHVKPTLFVAIDKESAWCLERTVTSWQNGTTTEGISITFHYDSDRGGRNRACIGSSHFHDSQKENWEWDYFKYLVL